MHFLAKAVVTADSQKEQEKPQHQESVNFEVKDLDEEEDLIKESRISKIVTESITKKVIVLILVLLIVFSFG